MAPERPLTPSEVERLVEIKLHRLSISVLGIDPDDAESIRDNAETMAWLRQQKATAERRRDQHAKVIPTVLSGLVISILVWLAGQLGIKLPAGLVGP